MWEVSAIQLLYRSTEELAYDRARHYIGREDGKPQFECHKKSIDTYRENLIKSPKKKIIK
jgi:hypothetical protein